MLRAVLSVIIGFLVLTILVVIGFSISYLALGQDGTFEGDGWEVSSMWIILTSIAGLIAALGGGALCAVIAPRGSKAPLVFIAIIFIFGIGEAIYKHAVAYPANETEAPPRSESITMQEAANYAREPIVVSFLNPFIGAIGIFLGARLTGRQKAMTTPPSS